LNSRIWNNPVITSEMKIKMRGWRTALGIAAYLGVLLLIGFLYYLAFIDYSLSWSNSINARQEAGMQIYSVLAILQFSLVLLITPAQTAGSISGEREKQTLELLLSTKIPSLGIIFGKLIASMSYIILLIITSIPLFSLVFLFGGVTPGDMAKLFLFYIVTAFCSRQYRHLLFHPVQADSGCNGSDLPHHFSAGIGECDTGCIYGDGSVQCSQSACQSCHPFCSLYQSCCRAGGHSCY
jgi:hypothetical protein